MPTPITVGALSARALGWTSNTGASATFVAEHHYSPTATSQSVSLAGASAGQLAMIFVVNGATTPTGWTLLISQTGAGSFVQAVFSKRLTSTDISTGSITVTGLDVSQGGASAVGIVFYASATRVTSVSSVINNTGITIPGYNKSALCKGVVTFVGATQGPPPTVPTGTTQRIAYSAANAFALGVADFLPPSAYTSGASVTWGVTAGIGGAIFELQ